MEKLKKKTEIQHEGVTIVFGDAYKVMGTNEQFLVKCIRFYAALVDREVKIIFFNGEEKKTGVNFLFK